MHELYQSIPCERSELTSLRVRHCRPRRAAGSPSAQRNTPLAPHTIDTALGSPCAPHPARNSIKYRNGCVALKEVGRRPTDCSLRSKPDLKPHFILRNACFIRRIQKKGNYAGCIHVTDASVIKSSFTTIESEKLELRMHPLFYPRGHGYICH